MSKFNKFCVLLALAYGKQLPLDIVREALEL